MKDSVFCPICEGRGHCLECADGRTFDEYERVQAAHQAEIDRATRAKLRSQRAWPGHRGPAVRAYV